MRLHASRPLQLQASCGMPKLQGGIADRQRLDFAGGPEAKGVQYSQVLIQQRMHTSRGAWGQLLGCTPRRYRCCLVACPPVADEEGESTCMRGVKSWLGTTGLALGCERIRASTIAGEQRGEGGRYQSCL